MGFDVGRGLSHELGKTRVWARTAVTVTSFCLEGEVYHASLSGPRGVNLFFVVNLDRGHRIERVCSNAPLNYCIGRGRTFVRSVETPCRAEEGSTHNGICFRSPFTRLSL